MRKYNFKNGIRYMSLILAMVIIAIPVTRSVAVDNQSEYVSIEYDNSSPTNEDVIVSIEVLDEDSGVDKLTYLNNDIEEEISLKDQKASFVAKDNGDYIFKAYDKAGNETTAKVVITNIDRILPELTLTPSITEKTNEDVVIKVEATDNVKIEKIILPDGRELEAEEGDYTVDSNGTYEFKAIDTAGNTTIKSIEISNINKDKPIITINDYNKEWTNKDITVTAEVDKGTLNEESYTFTENGSFTFVVTDEYGNTSEETVTITNIDKTPPKINIKVIR